MEFIQGDILDKEIVQKYFYDADIVHHLAGVTDVPRTKSEANEDRDKISTHLKTIVPKFDEETKAHLAYIKEAVIKYGKSKKNN